LLIDPDNRVIQFYSLTSSEKWNGRRIVEAVAQAIPDNWMLAVAMDWSGGFWAKMVTEVPRIEVL